MTQMRDRNFWRCILELARDTMFRAGFVIIKLMATIKANTDFRHRMPSDLQLVLNKHKDVHALWENLTPLARNEWICWVTIVKKKETRQEHLERLQEDLKKGKKRPCCWPGCPHRRVSAKK